MGSKDMIIICANRNRIESKNHTYLFKSMEGQYFLEVDDLECKFCEQLAIQAIQEQSARRKLLNDAK